MVERMLIGLAAAAAVALAAGCGGGSDAASATAPETGPKAAPVAVEVSDTGYAMPDRIEGGVVAMRFRNVGTQAHEFAMGRADAGHTPDEIAATVAGAADGEPPAWLHDVAGPGLLTPGAAITVTRALAPGAYVVFDGVPDARGERGAAHGIVTTFTVGGNSGAALPHADAVITAGDKGFRVPPIEGGTRTIELRNAAKAPRGFMIATLNPGKTEADAGRWGSAIESTGRMPRGPVPATFLGAIQTIPSGTSVYLTADLQAHREYVLSDDQSGAMSRFTPR